jgi:magnesium transporter
MYIFEEGMKKVEQPQISPEKREIIFSTVQNREILDWLLKNGFHESFIEDITSEEQTVTFENEERFQLIIFKYIGFDEEERLLYSDSNIVIIITPTKFFVLGEEREVIVELARKFEKRYRKDYPFEYVFYLIADILIDSTILLVDVIDSTLEDIEDAIFKDDIEEEELQKDIYYTRRTLNRISKVVIQEREVIKRVYKTFSSEMQEQLRYEFIDLQEHLKYLVDETKTLLDRTGYLLNLYMGLLSTQMNKAMQKLAGISILFMPITFLAGVYGMNFQYLPEIHWRYGYLYFWVLVVVILLVTFFWLKRQKLL